MFRTTWRLISKDWGNGDSIENVSVATETRTAFRRWSTFGKVFAHLKFRRPPPAPPPPFYSLCLFSVISCPLILRFPLDPHRWWDTYKLVRYNDL